MEFLNIKDKQPEHNQWIVVHWAGAYKCGQFKRIAGMADRIVDHNPGAMCRYYEGFEYWAPLPDPEYFE